MPSVQELRNASDHNETREAYHQGYHAVWPLLQSIFLHTTDFLAAYPSIPAYTPNLLTVLC